MELFDLYVSEKAMYLAIIQSFPFRKAKQLNLYNACLFYYAHLSI